MNRSIRKRSVTIKQALVFFTLALIFNASVSAGQQSTSGLTEKQTQKQAFDHMHHKLHDDQAMFKAKEAQALKELNAMAIREDIKLEAVNAKIDELMAAKNKIMRLRYAHLVEMRKALTDEQKVGYDKALLQRSAVK